MIVARPGRPAFAPPISPAYEAHAAQSSTKHPIIHGNRASSAATSGHADAGRWSRAVLDADLPVMRPTARSASRRSSARSFPAGRPARRGRGRRRPRAAPARWRARVSGGGRPSRSGARFGRQAGGKRSTARAGAHADADGARRHRAAKVDLVDDRESGRGRYSAGYSCSSVDGRNCEPGEGCRAGRGGTRGRYLRAPSPTSTNARGNLSPSSAASTASTRSAAAARARARRTPSASISSSVSRSPAVSTSVTGTPPSTTRVSNASRVVQGVAATMATSRSASALTRLDLPTFGGPVTANTSPSRSRSPRRPSSRCASISRLSPASSASASALGSSGGRSSSGKSISASCCASMTRKRSAQPRKTSPQRAVELAQRLGTLRRGLRVNQVADRLGLHRSIRPFRNARRVNSPGSAGRGTQTPPARPRRHRPLRGRRQVPSSAASSPV